MKNTRGNINGPFGQSGSLELLEVTGPTYTLTEADGGKEIRATGACVFTVESPANGEPSPGWFTSVVRIGAGAVSFAGSGVTVQSSAGATPAIADQFDGATLCVEANGNILVIGALA